EDELRSERRYVAGLYSRLDTERAKAKERYAAALLGDGAALMDRDVEVHALAKQMKRLNVADNGLCFGRLDSTAGDAAYIGGVGLLEDANGYESSVLCSPGCDSSC